MSSKTSELKSRRFGTFGGVFTPNVLTILGVILFLRAGWVVGNTGLLGALLIIVISNFISLSTGLSLSAIATNMDVKAGGNYYMISRTLGLEVGGSIGIPLYFSQALSVAFYVIGFTEGLRWVFPQLNPILTASITCTILLFISFIGADLALKVQYFILAVLCLSLVSFFAGWTGSQHTIVFWNQSKVGFWPVFAVFFPAVTGIEVGVSMSGDLKDPQYSISRGTLMAIGVTFLVYVAQAVWLSLNASGAELSRNLMVMKTVARWPRLINAGLWAATISSALGCIVAAPRTLQALALDKILPGFIAKGSKRTNEPRIAIIITFIIAEACILLGGLDTVAPVITMFFLNTYGVINLLAVLENLIGNPSYRPQVKVPWLISLAGAVGCYAAMFLIHAPATIVAIITTLCLYVYLGRKDIQSTWGDIKSGIWFSLARFALLKLEDSELYPQNWRPNILVFSGNHKTGRHLIFFAHWLGKKKGIVSLYQMIFGNNDFILRHSATATKILNNFISTNNLPALGHVCIAEDFRSGIKQVCQTSGMGRMQSNLVLLGWCKKSSREIEFARLIRDLHYLQKSVLILNIPTENAFGNYKRIDVWWGGMQNNGNLMILIAYLICQNSEWRECEINLNMIIAKEQGRAAATTNLKKILQDARIEANVNVFVQDSPKVKVPYLIRKHSQDADLVILGMRLPEEGQEEAFIERMILFLAGLPTALLIKSVENIELTT